jgi:hypothetical protein
LKEVTKMELKLVAEFECGGSACPRIYQTERDTYVICGLPVSDDIKAQISLNASEDAVEIAGSLIENLLK